MYAIILFATLVGSIICEPPVGIGGYGGGGHGGNIGNEGVIPGSIVDQALLDRITNILNQQESQLGYSSGVSSSYGAPSAPSYGPPSPVYGAPAGPRGRIQLGKVSQGIQVANFVEHGQQGGYLGGGGSSGGYSGGGSLGGYGGGGSLGGYGGGGSSGGYNRR